MKITKNESDDFYSMHSEGKLLEIIPVITDMSGQPFMLPPTVYHVPNELLGYMDEHHVVGMPYQMYMRERLNIPGSVSNRGSDLTFLIRVLEDSPSVEIKMGHIDKEAVIAITDVIRHSISSFPGKGD